MSKGVFSVSINGQDATGAFTPFVMSISVTLNADTTADSASVTLDDKNAQISLPSIGDSISIGLGLGTAVPIFDGTIDDINSDGGRSGRTLSITAKSADHVKGKLKGRRHKHADDMKLGDVMQKWGQDAGLSSIHVHETLATIRRGYWSMNNESFTMWAARMARQYGATFKVLGMRGVMVPRNAGVSATGKPLTDVTAAWGVNLISWSIKPKVGRPQHKTFRTKKFDRAKAEWSWKVEDPSYDTDAEADHTATHSEPDDDAAASRSKSNMLESDRDRGTGSVTIDGNLAAQPEATCQVVGARPGVDGSYRIDTVTHSFSRGGEWVSDLTVKQPKGDAGQDTRKTKAAAGASEAGSTALPAVHAPEGGGVGHA